MHVVNKNKYLYFGLLVGFIVLATIISSGYSRDSLGYHNYFVRFGSSSWSALSNEMFHKELFFVFLSKLFYKSGIDAIFLFIVFSIVSISVKFYLILNLSRDKLLSIALFGSCFFLVHDATQIRFSLAVAFAYLGLYYLSINRRFIFLVVVFLSSIMFHIGSLVFLSMLFFTTKRSIAWSIALVFLALSLYPVNLNVVLLEFIGDITTYFGTSFTFFDRLDRYLLRPSQEEYLGVFKPTMILVYIATIILYKYRNKFNAYEMLCFNALILAIFFYILMKDIVDMQIRFRDIFFFSLVFLVPYIHEWLASYMGKRNAYAILMLSFTVYLAKFIFYDKMLVL